jgi:hypothetical protein
MRHRSTNIGGRRFPKLIIVLGALGSSCVGVPAALSEESDSPAVLKLTCTLQVITKTATGPDAACPLKQVVEGVGLTNLLGPVHDTESHCAHPGGAVDQGVFTLTGATLEGSAGGSDSKDSITGHYRAHLVPSIGSSLSGGQPVGYWLAYGEVCIFKGTGKFAAVVNDCPTAASPCRFFPARLAFDLNTGQANIFGTALVRLNDTDQ